MKKQLSVLAITLLMSTTTWASFGGSSSSRYPFNDNDSVILFKSGDISLGRATQALEEKKAQHQSIVQTLDQKIADLNQEIIALNRANQVWAPLDQYGRPVGVVSEENAQQFLHNVTAIAQKSMILSTHQ